MLKNMKYDDSDIVRYWKNKLQTKKRTRKRIHIDPRDYAVALLYYKYGYTEETLSFIFDVHRTTINHCKKNTYYLLLHNDSKFLENIKEIRKKFPYNFPHPGENTSNILRQFRITIPLLEEDYILLTKISKAKSERRDVVAKLFLRKQINNYLIENLKWIEQQDKSKG